MRTVIVTGASRGIGSATARKLAKVGYAIAVNYNHSADSAEALCQEINHDGGLAVPIKADISSTKDVERLFKLSYEQLGTPYALINNAGIALKGAVLQDVSDEELDTVISTNLIGAIKCSREALKYMVSRGIGRIVNISSIWGQVGGACEVAYSASKAGIIGLTKALSQEIAPSGITVNCIAPGVIDTEMIACYSDSEIEALRCEIPVGRLGTSEDIAAAIEFLISDSAAFITGQILGVNGGFV